MSRYNKPKIMPTDKLLDLFFDYFTQDHRCCNTTALVATFTDNTYCTICYDEYYEEQFEYLMSHNIEYLYFDIFDWDDPQQYSNVKFKYEKRAGGYGTYYLLKKFEQIRQRFGLPKYNWTCFHIDSVGAAKDFEKIEKNQQILNSDTVQVYDRLYRTDRDFIKSHIKSGQHKFGCAGYLLTETDEEPLKYANGMYRYAENHMRYERIPYSQLVTMHPEKGLQIAYLAYTTDKKKLSKAVDLPHLNCISAEDIDSFIESYDKVMIQIPNGIGQSKMFDRFRIW